MICLGRTGLGSKSYPYFDMRDSNKYLNLEIIFWKVHKT